jgi:hypothetical protein
MELKKQGAIGNTLGGHIGNLGTYWEPDENPLELERNMLGTNENRKKIPPPKTPTPSLKLCILEKYLPQIQT